ncbi:hypothetical protein [Mycetocola reblochoni]|uniref:hypothetical protein n=1 Tax=Mycetocola reblochoni TaxID=331618 RepID=UPI00117F6287|nr:hypothetical protein [Mycetocola reblochoni]
MAIQGEQMERFRELGLAVYSALGEGDSHIEYRVSLVGLTGRIVALRYNPAGNLQDSAGRFFSAEVPSSADSAARALRELMFEPGKGTWFSAVVTVTAEGRASVSYNYDDEPEGPGGQGFDPVAYKIEFEKFPRDEAHTPEWLRQRLAEAVELNKKRAALPRDQWFD